MIDAPTTILRALLEDLTDPAEREAAYRAANRANLDFLSALEKNLRAEGLTKAADAADEVLYIATRLILK